MFKSIPDISEITSIIKNFNLNEDWHFLLIGTGILVVFILIVRRIRRKKPKVVEIVNEIEEVEAAEVEEDESVDINVDAIIEFFLRIYKSQVGAPQSAKSNFKLLETKSGIGRQTYELKVHHQTEWLTRRMSLSPLGEESGSRSQCYYIIFDDHLVIKIPQKAIRDFDDYLEAIVSDQKIVNRLNPRECIVPTVSALLKLVHPLSQSKDLSAAELEEKYQNTLQRYKKFKDFFKIRNTYVFVMDLSRYFFLSHIIDDIHKLQEKLHHDITGYPDVIWENHGFEGRYGFENDAVVDAIKDVYRAVEQPIKTYVKKIGLEKSVGDYQTRQWFLIHLAGRQIDKIEKGMSTEQLSAVNKLFKKHFTKHAEAVEAYRNTICGCIQEVTVQQNKQQLGGLITNILDLLTWLRKKSIAVRDLKPDNLLVAGDQSQYPQFLDSMKSYTVGLIDMETAVDYSDDEGIGILQPVLGGTPSYATPSHLYANGALESFFGDFTRILRLQDWFAAVGMIYEVIVGERLFNQSGKLIVGIKNMTMSPDDDYDAQFALFSKTSGMFWHSAHNELSKKMEIKENLLRLVKVVIPDKTREMLRTELLEERLVISGRIKKCVASQSVIRGEKNIQGLIGASREKISQLKTKMSNDLKKGPANENKKQAIRVLDSLEKLKAIALRNAGMIKLFSKPKLALSAYELLFQLFYLVQNSMYREEWGERQAASVVGVGDDNETTTVESTV